MRNFYLILIMLGAIPAVITEDARGQTTPAYTITDLGTLGGTYSYAYGINNAGQIAGWSSTSGDRTDHATLFGVSAGQVTCTDLGTLAGSGSYSYAYGINSTGQISGSSPTVAVANGGEHAALFGVSGGTVTRADLGTLGGAYSYSFGINDTGQIVGYSETGGYYGPGFAIRHAALFATSGGTVTRTDLGTLGGSASGAYGINNAGQIAGFSSTSGGAQHATLFSTSGGMVTRTDLGTLGGNDSVAYSINNAGQIAGYSTISGNMGQHAFLYMAAGGMKDLNNLVGTSPSATNIAVNSAGNLLNDWGQIVAYGTVAGQTHGLLLNLTTPNSSVAGSMQNTKLVDSMNYNKTPAISFGTGGTRTTATLLDGATGSAGASTFGRNRDFTETFSRTIDDPVGALTGKVYISGASGDTFVLQMSYNEAGVIALGGSESAARLGRLNTTTGKWENAVFGDAGASPIFIQGAYDPAADFHLGYYGLDTANNTVWAVLNYESDFAVTVPEPATWAGGAGLIVILIFVRRSKLAPNANAQCKLP